MRTWDDVRGRLRARSAGSVSPTERTTDSTRRRSEAVADARAAGLEVRDIAVLINEDESTVYKILRAAGVQQT